MECKILTCNSGVCVLNTNSETLKIKKHIYFYKNQIHGLKSDDEKFYKRIHSLEFNFYRVYYLNTFNSNDGKCGFHIGLNFWQNQQFLFLQNEHWFQKEENIRYVVNILFLTGGLILGFLKIKN